MASGGLGGPKMLLTCYVPPYRRRRPPTTMSSTLSPTDFDNLEIQGQYSDINNRWDLPDSDWDNDSSSARLFERSRIKALAGEVRGGPGGMVRTPGTDACCEESFNFIGRLTFFLSCCTQVGNHPIQPLIPNSSLKNKLHAIQNVPQLPSAQHREAMLIPGPSCVPLYTQLTSWPLSLSHVLNAFALLLLPFCFRPPFLCRSSPVSSLASAVISHTCSPSQPISLSCPSPPVPSTCHLFLPLFLLPVP